MAKITIIIEDLPNGNVSVVATPNFSEIAKLDLSGQTLTPAHGYAMAALNKIRAVSKQNGPTNTIFIPRIGRA